MAEQPPAKRQRSAMQAKMAARHAISQRLESLSTQHYSSAAPAPAAAVRSTPQTGAAHAAGAASPATLSTSISCTACDKRVSGPTVWPHPSLHHVAVCENCFEELCNDLVEQEDERADAESEANTENCAWCLETGVEVMCCDECPRAYCERCIRDNLGRDEVQRVKDTDPWSCYHCEPSDGQRLSSLRAEFNKAAEPSRDQILTDQLMAVEEDIDDTNRCLEQANLDRLRDQISSELRSSEIDPSALEARVTDELAEYAAQCRYTERCLQARKLALMDALEPLLRLQKTSLLTVLKEREKVIKQQAQRQPASTDDPWRDSVVYCCESESDEDSLSDSESDVAADDIEPAVHEIVASKLPKWARRADRVLDKRDKMKTLLGSLPEGPLYSVETPSEALEKGLSGAVVEIADIKDLAYDDDLNWHRSQQRKVSYEQLRQADVEEQRKLRQMSTAARPLIRKRYAKRPSLANSARGSKSGLEEEGSKSSDESSEEEEAEQGAARAERNSHRQSTSTHRSAARAPEDIRPAWQGSAAQTSATPDSFNVGLYYGPDGSTPVEVVLGAEQDTDGWPSLVSGEMSLKAHQKDGVKFIWKSSIEAPSGCVVAHCMGLGKTLEAIAVIRCIFQYGIKFHDTVRDSPIPKERPACVLVVAPKSTIYNWGEEFQRWAAKVTVTVIDSNTGKVQRLGLLKRWYRTGGVLLLGYETFVNVCSIKRDELVTTLQSKRLPELEQLAKDRGWSARDIEDAWNDDHPEERLSKMLLEEVNWLQNPGPDLVIVDEAHKLKDKHRQLCSQLSCITTQRRIALTGTPFQNNLLEYYAMLDWVKPGILGTVKDYKNQYVEPIEAGQHTDSSRNDVARMKRRAHALHKKLKQVIHRRDHTVLERDLPTKREYVLYVRLSDLQQKLYRTFLQNRKNALGDGVTGKGIMSDKATLFKIISHPQMLRLERNAKKKRPHSTSTDRTSPMDDATFGRVSPAEEFDESSTRGSASPELNDDKWWEDLLPADSDDCDDILSCSPKLAVLIELIKLCLKQKEKMLIFSNSTAMLDVVQRVLCKTPHPDPSVEDFDAAIDSASTLGSQDGPTNDDRELVRPLWQEDKHFCRLDGDTTSKRRQELCNQFNGCEYEPGGCSVFLLSTTAGGMGINLVAASRCVMLDDHFNPSVNVQALFRSYRYGQERPVVVYRLLSAGTMEEAIYRTVLTKQVLSHRIVDAQAISRHCRKEETEKFYEFDPEPEWEDNDEEEDEVLNDVRSCDVGMRWVVRHHEHSSLLKDKPEERITDEEKLIADQEEEKFQSIIRTRAQKKRDESQGAGRRATDTGFKPVQQRSTILDRRRRVAAVSVGDGPADQMAPLHASAASALSVASLKRKGSEEPQIVHQRSMVWDDNTGGYVPRQAAGAEVVRDTKSRYFQQQRAERREKQQQQQQQQQQEQQQQQQAQQQQQEQQQEQWL